jgi:hypothetical protein
VFLQRLCERLERNNILPAGEAKRIWGEILAELQSENRPRGSWQSLDSSPVNANLHFMRKTPHRILPRIDASLTDTEIARKEQFLHTLNERAKTALAQLAAPRTSP